MSEPKGTEIPQTGGNGDPNATGNNSGGNNTENVFDPNKPLWQAPAQNPQQAGNGQPSSGQAEEVDHAAALSEFVGKQNFAPQFTQEQMNAMQNGDFSGVSEAINKANQTVFQNMLGLMVKLGDQIQRNAVQQAVNQSRNDVTTDKHVQAMETALPWTKDPNVGHVAKATLRQFLGQGLSQDKAIEGVKQFFGYVHKQSGSMFEQPNNSNPPGRRPGSSTQTGKQSGDEDDFIAMLTQRQN